MNLMIDGSRRAKCTVVLAHGAGAGMDTEFMNTVAEGIARHAFRVVRFEFPYMAERRKSGKRCPPDREPALRACWLEVLETLNADKLVIGGKSMGGRIASLIADDVAAAGLICFGYPFHPSRKTDKLRIDHLKKIKTPTLIVQGERDALGSLEEVVEYDLSASIQVHWLTDGDHSFNPRKRSGKTLRENLEEAVAVTAKFLSVLC